MPAEWFQFRLISTSIVAVLITACGQKPAAPPQQDPEVGVVTLKASAVTVSTELPGRTSALLVAQVRARVDGIVLRREFVEGAQVKQGQRLYKIDPAPYIAALNSAKASLAKAEANLVTTKALSSRYKVLVASNAVSKQDFDNAVASEGQAGADVAAAKASVETAQINLGYTDVVSPVSGKVGISQVTPGAYVQASQATLMSTVQQLDRVYVDVTQSSLDGLRTQRSIEEGRIKTAGPDASKVTLILEDGREYKEKGQLQFSDITVDQTTGSVTIRAIFPNPLHVLLPGMFVRTRIDEGVNENALLVPQIGVTHDQKGMPTALAVGADNKVVLKKLITSEMQGQDWVVEAGLSPGDRVIVQGVEKARPGMTVKPVPAAPTQAAAPSSDAQGKPAA